MDAPTPSHVALLRAVNVTGHNPVPMPALRELFADLGYPGARTHVQSGNVVFAAGADGRKRTALAAKLRAAIAERFDVDTPVILRTRAELAKAIAASPYAADEIDETKVHIAFLEEKPTAAAVSELDPDRSPGDVFTVVGRELHIHYGPNGAGRSKLDATFLGKLGTPATARNLRSARAILALLDDSG